MVNHSTLLICGCFLSNFLISTSYLTNNHWSILLPIIQNKDTHQEVRTKIQKLIYFSYEKWAINQAYQFKYYHKYKSRNIDLENFIYSSKIGLYKSIQQYQGKSEFSLKSRIYIQWELYDCLTQLYPLTILPKQYRKKSKSGLNAQERRNYKNQLESSFVSYDEYWRFDKLDGSNKKEKIRTTKELTREIWEQIYECLYSDPIALKILSLKYDYRFVPLCSNRYISEMLGYSEEYVRRKMNQSKKKIISIFNQPLL
jgi:hypothetical protein